MSISKGEEGVADAALRQQLNILRKPSHRRTRDDLKALNKSFANVQFFKELEAAVALQVCRMLRLEFFACGRTVFKEGDAGDQFYVILDGSVGVYIKEVVAQDVEVEGEDDYVPAEGTRVSFSDVKEKEIAKQVIKEGKNPDEAVAVQEVESLQIGRGSKADDDDEGENAEPRRRTRLKSILRNSGMMKDIQDTLTNEEQDDSKEKEVHSDSKDLHKDSHSAEKQKDASSSATASCSTSKENTRDKHKKGSDVSPQRTGRLKSILVTQGSKSDKELKDVVDKAVNLHTTERAGASIVGVEGAISNGDQTSPDSGFERRKARRSSTWSADTRRKDLLSVDLDVNSVKSEAANQFTVPRSPRGSFAPTLSAKKAVEGEIADVEGTPNSTAAHRRARRSSTWTPQSRESGTLQASTVFAELPNSGIQPQAGDRRTLSRSNTLGLEGSALVEPGLRRSLRRSSTFGSINDSQYDWLRKLQDQQAEQKRASVSIKSEANGEGDASAEHEGELASIGEASEAVATEPPLESISSSTTTPISSRRATIVGSCTSTPSSSRRATIAGSLKSTPASSRRATVVGSLTSTPSSSRRATEISDETSVPELSVQLASSSTAPARSQSPTTPARNESMDCLTTPRASAGKVFGRRSILAARSKVTPSAEAGSEQTLTTMLQRGAGSQPGSRRTSVQIHSLAGSRRVSLQVESTLRLPEAPNSRRTSARGAGEQPEASQIMAIAEGEETEQVADPGARRNSVRRCSLMVTEDLTSQAHSSVTSLQNLLSAKAMDRQPGTQEWLRSVQPKATLNVEEMLRRSLTIKQRRQSAPGASLVQMQSWRRKSLFQARHPRRVSHAATHGELDDIKENCSDAGDEDDEHISEESDEDKEDENEVPEILDNLARRSSGNKSPSLKRPEDRRGSAGSTHSAKRSDSSDSTESWSLFSEDEEGEEGKEDTGEDSNKKPAVEDSDDEDEDEEEGDEENEDQEEGDDETPGKPTPARTVRGTAGGDQLRKHLDKLQQLDGGEDNSSKSGSSSNSDDESDSDSDSSEKDEFQIGNPDSKKQSKSSFKSSARSSRRSTTIDDSNPDEFTWPEERQDEEPNQEIPESQMRQRVSFSARNPDGSKPRVSFSRRVSTSKLWLGKLQNCKRRISYLEKLMPKVLEVAVIKAGGAFGEVALQTDQPRSATIKTKEDAYFATLSRNDYKAILQNSVEKQQRERMLFLTKQPILEGLSNHAVNKIACMLQQRIVTRNECVYDFDTPVLQVFFAKEGEFKVCCRLRPMDPEDMNRDDDGNNIQGIARTRSSLVMAKKDGGESRSVCRKRDAFVTVALLTPPSVFGLTGYIKGERRYNNRVVCSSVTGTVYCILAKEMVHHLSRETRDRLQVAACTEERFYDNRLLVLRELDAPLERCGSHRGGRRWQTKQTIIERIRAARGETTNSLSAYSPQGRLKAIRNVFKQEENKQSDLLKAFSNPEEEENKQSDEKDAEKDNELQTCWFMQEMLVAEAAATEGPKYGLAERLAQLPSTAETSASLMPADGEVAPAALKQKAFAQACWDNAQLAKAYGTNVLHASPPKRQPRGRADGKVVAVRKAFKRSPELREARAVTSVRGGCASPGRSLSPGSSSGRQASPSSRDCSRERPSAIAPAEQLAQTDCADANTAMVASDQLSQRQSRFAKNRVKLHALYSSNISTASTAALSDMSGNGRSYMSLSTSVSMTSLTDMFEELRPRQPAGRRVQLPDLLSPLGSECFDSEGLEKPSNVDYQLFDRSEGRLPELSSPAMSASKPSTADVLSRELLQEMNEVAKQLESLPDPMAGTQNEAELGETMPTMPTAESWKAIDFFSDHLFRSFASSNGPTTQSAKCNNSGLVSQHKSKRTGTTKKSLDVLPQPVPPRQIFSKKSNFSSALSSKPSRHHMDGGHPIML